MRNGERCLFDDAFGRSACGIETFPLIRVDELKDGGKSFQYDFDGTEVWMNVPPPDFDAARATPNELDTYGIPAAPSGIEAADWTTTMFKSTFVLPPDFLVRVPVQAVEERSNNWAGFVATGDTFTNASVTYTEPIAQGCAGATFAIWAGLGGYNGSPNLAQNGTIYGAIPYFYAHEAWWEILPSSAVAMNFSASPGYQFYSSTQFNTTTNRWSFYWYN